MKMLKTLLVATICAFLGMTSLTPAYSSDTVVPPTTQQESGGIDGIAAGVTGALEESESALYKICIALFPISLIILIILIIASHNDKKLSGYISMAGIVFIATLCVILIENGTALNILESLADLFKM